MQLTIKGVTKYLIAIIRCSQFDAANTVALSRNNNCDLVATYLRLRLEKKESSYYSTLLRKCNYSFCEILSEKKILKSTFLSLFCCLKQITFFGSFDELKWHSCVNFLLIKCQSTNDIILLPRPTYSKVPQKSSTSFAN